VLVGIQYPHVEEKRLIMASAAIAPILGNVVSKLKCPVFLARDLSGLG